MTGWLQIDGTVHALPARRGDEDGAYLWIDAGNRDEAIHAELYLPAVDATDLDLAMTLAIGMVDHGGIQRSGEVRIEFGRVADGRGVLTATGGVLDADVRFDLIRQPPGGGFCRHCGSPLEVRIVSVITPPDGGLIGAPETSCEGCGRS